MLSRWFGRRAWAPLAIAIALPLSLQAQERVLGTWNGRVDKEMQLTIRADTITSNTVGGEQLAGRFRLESALPQQDGDIRVAVSRGRGDVSVVQQPSSANNYTAVVRMLDDDPGADSYQVTVYWSPMHASRGNMGSRAGTNRAPSGPSTGSTLHWSGDVDVVAEIRWGANGVSQHKVGGGELRNVQSSQGGGGVLQGGTVTATLRAGRGTVQIVQQPSAENNWTAVIRVHDPQPGYGHYELDASWQ